MSQKYLKNPYSNKCQIFFDNFFAMYHCGFRKDFIAQDCLIVIFQKWKSCNDKEKSFGALITDPSKAFDCLSHELVVTKMHAYSFDQQALELINSYLSERK